MNFFKILLFPFSIIYWSVTQLRNHLFNIGIKKSIEFNVPVISVGNLIAGGSGKTPMVEYLVRKFQDTYSICTLSRGYGRKTSGFRMATEEDNSTTIGDEPFQFFQKYHPKVSVAVGEERALAIPEILNCNNKINLILLDDAYQHRYVKPKFNILLTEYQRPFFRDHVLPMGLLRESRKGAERADAIIVTKCPGSFDENEKEFFIDKINKYALDTPVFFTTIIYDNPLPGNHIMKKENKVVSVSGIANPKPFEEYIDANYSLVECIRFPDHHRFSEKDIHKINNQLLKYGKDTIVLTTEKDYGRLKPFLKQFSSIGLKVFYLPIKSHFLFDENKFDKLVSDAIIAVQRGEHS